jgi:hypothetical protein
MHACGSFPSPGFPIERCKIALAIGIAIPMLRKQERSVIASFILVRSTHHLAHGYLDGTHNIPRNHFYHGRVLDQHRRCHPRSRAREGRASARSSSTRSLSTVTQLRSRTSENGLRRWRANAGDLHSWSPRLGGAFLSSLAHFVGRSLDNANHIYCFVMYKAHVHYVL